MLRSLHESPCADNALVVDLFPFYPEHLRPAFMQTLRTFYIETYHDRLFTQPPAWFMMYMWVELLYVKSMGVTFG